MVKILFYDIETTPLKAWIWGLGEQVILHNQLIDRKKTYDIICISYCWNDDKPAKIIDWGRNKDTSKVIKEFDKLAKQADVIIGKNSDRFDSKMINTQRMLNNLDGMPDWLMNCDDLEKQMRKHFYLPSYRLDYFSNLLGLGGKHKMELDDWIKIVEYNDKNALNKMMKYCKKDVEDTRALWNRVSKYITPKFNMATLNGELSCINCGSKDIYKNGTRPKGKILYQNYFCRTHGGYAGKMSIEGGKIGS